MSEFRAEEPQQILNASEGLAQGPYVAARAGFEPTTFQMKGSESTSEPPRPARGSFSSALVPHSDDFLLG